MGNFLLRDIMVSMQIRDYEENHKATEDKKSLDCKED